MTYYPGSVVAAGNRISDGLQVQVRAEPTAVAAAGCQFHRLCSHMTFYPGAGVAAGHRISDGLQVQVREEPTAGTAAGCQSHRLCSL